MKIWRRLIFSGIAAWMACLLPALRADNGELRTSTAETRRKVLATIEAQLAAFRAHDPAKAYLMAAAPLRQQLPLANFTEIVRQTYPEIWTNSRATYGIVQDNGARATLTVRVFGAAGESASYDYILFLESGGWRIAGVLRHEPKPAAAV